MDELPGLAIVHRGCRLSIRRLLASHKFQLRHVAILVNGQSASVNLAFFQVDDHSAYPANLGSSAKSSHYNLQRHNLLEATPAGASCLSGFVRNKCRCGALLFRFFLPLLFLFLDEAVTSTACFLQLFPIQNSHASSRVFNRPRPLQYSSGYGHARSAGPEHLS